MTDAQLEIDQVHREIPDSIDPSLPLYMRVRMLVKHLKAGDALQKRTVKRMQSYLDAVVLVCDLQALSEIMAKAKDIRDKEVLGDE